MWGLFAVIDIAWLAGGVFLGVRYKDGIMAAKDKLVSIYNWIKAKV